MAKNFKDLSEQEILALAISSEETDARIYADFAAGLKADYPATAQIFKEMEAEEDEHRRKLIEDYRRRFGEHIPLIRREDVKGFVHRKPVWMIGRWESKRFGARPKSWRRRPSVSTSVLPAKSATRQRANYSATSRKRNENMSPWPTISNGNN